MFFVNQATEGRGRIYSAHSSINSYCSYNFHVEILSEELKEKFKKKSEKKKQNLLILWVMLKELLISILLPKNMLKSEENNK